MSSSYAKVIGGIDGHSVGLREVVVGPDCQPPDPHCDSSLKLNPLATMLLEFPETMCLCAESYIIKIHFSWLPYGDQLVTK